MGTIGLQVPVNNEFTQCFSTGVIQAANDAGYAVKIKQSAFDDADVLVDFDAFIAEGVKGIVVLPSSDQSSSQGTIAADAAGIPVSNAGWFSETPADAIWVGRLKVDVAAGARMIAEWVGANTEAAEVVFVSGAPGLPTNVAFEDALGPAIDALDGDWSLVGTEAGFYTRDGAITAIENLMTAHPNAKIVVALSADMADGVVTWMTNNNRTDITLISGDSNLALVKNMKDGKIKSDLYWGPAEQGASATSLLLEFLSTGTKQTDITPIPISMETPDTIDATVAARPICLEALLPEAQAMQ
jgi:ABC-type sugar transport system substrate-binding protein